MPGRNSRCTAVISSEICVLTYIIIYGSLRVQPLYLHGEVGNYECEGMCSLVRQDKAAFRSLCNASCCFVQKNTTRLAQIYATVMYTIVSVNKDIEIYNNLKR